MSDVFVLGAAVVSVVFGVIIYYVMKMVGSETSFEEAYGENARNLLKEDRGTKNKPKNQKKRYNKAERVKKREAEQPPTPQEQDEAVPEPEDPVLEPEAPVVQEAAPAPVNIPIEESQEAKAAVKKNQKKRQNKAENVKKRETEQLTTPQKPEEPVTEPEAPVVLEAAPVTVPTEQPQEAKTAVKKNQKKRQNKAENVKKRETEQSPTPQETKKLVPVVQEAAHVNIPTDEPQEVAFIAVKKNQKKTRKVEPVPVVAKESKEVTLAVQQAEVTARNSAIELSKVTEQKQTSDNDNKVLEALRKSERVLQEDNNKLKTNLAKFQTEIDSRDSLLKQLTVDNQKHTSVFEEFKQKAQAVLYERSSELTKLHVIQKELEQRLTQANSTNDRLQKSLAELRAAQESGIHLTSQLTQSQATVESLRKEVEEFKADKENRVQAFNTESTQNKSKIEEYEKKILAVEKMKDTYAKEIDQMKEDIKKLNSDNDVLVKEKQELQTKLTTVETSQSISRDQDSEEVQKLQGKLDEVEAKNQDLRDRNYKLHEMVKESEDNVKKVVNTEQVKVLDSYLKTIGEALNISTPESQDLNTVKTWVASALTQRPALVASPSVEVVDTQKYLDEIERLKHENEFVRNAVEKAYEQLDTAARLSEESHSIWQKQNEEITSKLNHHFSRKNSSLAPSHTSEEWEVVG